MPSNKSKLKYFVLSFFLISGCSIVNEIFSPGSGNPTARPAVSDTAAAPALADTPIASQELSPAVSSADTQAVSPTDSQPLDETYFGLPYDSGVWTLIDSGKERIPPSLGLISDSYCSMGVNSSDVDLSVFIMTDKAIDLGGRAWTRRYYLDDHYNVVFEVYFTDEYPDEFYNQLAAGDYISTGGFRLLGLYETCRQATQELLAGML